MATSNSPTLQTKLLTSPDGIKVLAEAVGDPKNHAIVFLHGLSLTGAGFERQFRDPRLYENFFLVRYDLRGHGRSGMSFDAKSYESIRYAEEFKTVCEGFNVVKPSVVAWSLGGCIVVDVIEAYGSDYLSSIIYCGGALLTRRLHDEYIHPYVYSMVPALMSTDSDVVAATCPKYVDSIIHNVDKVLTFPEQLQFIGGFGMQPPTIRGLALTRTQESTVWEKEIRSKKVLIIQGTEDRHARADGLLETARKWIGEFEMKILEGVGHSPNIERAEEVNGYISEFLKKTVHGV